MTEPTQGAREVTKEEADRIVAATKAGSPATVPTSAPTVTVDEPKAPKPSAQPFVPLNPPVGVFSPAQVDDSIHGFLMAKGHDHRRNRNFYILELVAPCEAIEFEAGAAPEPAKPGTRVAVWEDETNLFLTGLLPNWKEQQNPTGPSRTVAGEATELVITAFRASGRHTGWDCLIRGRRVKNPTVGMPPMACVPDADPPEERGAIERVK